VKALLLALGASTSLAASAASEAEFRKCVEVKDLTLAVAEQANKGVSRAEVKSRLSSRAIDDLIDWVYDFRGVHSTQELARKSMDICLENLGRGNKRR
jgi:predicted HAD superfamily Cof-like phosphohydrolase